MHIIPIYNLPLIFLNFLIANRSPILLQISPVFRIEQTLQKHVAQDEYKAHRRSGVSAGLAGPQQQRCAGSAGGGALPSSASFKLQSFRPAGI